MKQKSLVQQWRQGPVSDHVLEPGHGRGIFCMSIKNDKLVTGSADHGLRIYNIQSMKYERELFTKKYGHHEWVTSVSILPSGRVLSAGMDSMLCLWDAKGVRCDNLLGHEGSITKVMTDEYEIGMSCSYDGTMILWNLGNLEEARKLFGPHKAAIMDFDWHNSLAVSGDRQGIVAFWDINEGEAVMQQKVHNGAVSQVVIYGDGGNNNIVITAGTNDGLLNVHDMRSNKMVMSSQIHKGAINSVKVNMQNFIVTGSADGTIRLIDIVSGFKTVCQMKAPDAIFCIDIIYNLTIAGCGDGNILVYDNDSGECLYGFGAMSKGAVRCMQMNDQKNKLVVCGDDFCPFLINFD